MKRLFVDRDFREGEAAADYLFIPAKVYDNTALLERSPEYLSQLRSLPPRLRAAWLDGSWNVFEGQFFSEFREECHVIPPFPLMGEGAPRLRFFAAMDYGFDMLALLLLALDEEGKIYAARERAVPGLTLSMAARELSELTRDFPVEYVAASPDLWNRRQDTGYSGFEIIRGQEQQGCVPPLPPLIPADNRRVEGWRALREALAVDGTAGDRGCRSFPAPGADPLPAGAGHRSEKSGGRLLPSPFGDPFARSAALRRHVEDDAARARAGDAAALFLPREDEASVDL